MMKIIKLEVINNTRIVLVELGAELGDEKGYKKSFLLGELPFYGDDTDLKIDFDMLGVIKYNKKEDAEKAFNNYKVSDEDN